jgi:hypothetical protein
VSDVSGWLEQQADRAASRQRSQVDTAKLLATFATGLAATLVATALQVPGSDWWEKSAVIILGVASLLSISVLIADRISEVDHAALLSQAHTQQWTAEELLGELRTAQIEAVSGNEGTVSLLRWLSGSSLVAAVAAGVCATVSMVFVRA